jgi:CheY-like chemotaxis protein
MSILLAEGDPTHRRFARQLLDQYFPDAGPVREVTDGAMAVQRALTEWACRVSCAAVLRLLLA